MRVAGIMSGTSLDGISLAVADITARGQRLLEHKTLGYPKALRERILAVSNQTAHTGEIARLHYEIPEHYARAVAALRTPGIELIGCHGQTIFHGKGCTLQLGEPAMLAERTRTPVVANFRAADIAAGGQGAPLVPFVDYRLFRHRTRNRVALNIGGIANITVLPASAAPEDVIAFDTGPGNMVLDQLAWTISKGKLRYDRDARLARGGHVNRGLLSALMQDRYYGQRPPKSTGREKYGTEFVRQLFATQLPLEDLLATATVFTALTIAEGIRRFSPPPDEIIAAGGGTLNPMLMDHLRALLPECSVVTTAEPPWRIPVDAKEALAFAILAYETWHKRPANLPSATGARHPAILGSITLPG